MTHPWLENREFFARKSLLCLAICNFPFALGGVVLFSVLSVHLNEKLFPYLVVSQGLALFCSLFGVYISGRPTPRSHWVGTTYLALLLTALLAAPICAGLGRLKFWVDTVQEQEQGDLWNLYAVVAGCFCMFVTEVNLLIATIYMSRHQCFGAAEKLEVKTVYNDEAVRQNGEYRSELGTDNALALPRLFTSPSPPKIFSHTARSGFDVHTGKTPMLSGYTSSHR